MKGVVNIFKPRPFSAYHEARGYVDNYKDGKIINHESAWRAGEQGARFGLMIPARPKVGDKFYQEIAPKVALDRVEVVSVDQTVNQVFFTFSESLVASLRFGVAQAKGPTQCQIFQDLATGSLFPTANPRPFRTSRTRSTAGSIT